MFTDVEFSQLQCSRQSDDDGSRPYLWVELLQIDDDGVIPISPADPNADKLVIADAMEAGDASVVPDQLAHFAAYFRPSLTAKHLVVVAALWDAKDTPASAVSAGYGAFLTAVPEWVGRELLALESPDPETVDEAIKGVMKQVEKAVGDAIESQISTLEGIEIELDLETPDRLIGSDFQHWDLSSAQAPGPFTLTFQNGTADSFTLSGDLLVMVNVCEEQLIAVDGIRESLALINGRLHQLASAHGGEPTPQDEQEMEQLEHERTAEQAKLKSAEDALKACLARISEIKGITNVRQLGRAVVRT